MLRKRIYHQPSIQPEKSQPEGKRIMNARKRGLPSFRHYLLTRGLGFLGLHRRPMFDFFSVPMTFIRHFLHCTTHKDLFRTSFGVFRGGAKMTSLLKFKVLTSLLTSCVSCPSPWARQNCPAPLKK